MARKALTLRDKLACLALERIMADANAGRIPAISPGRAAGYTADDVLKLVTAHYEWAHSHPVSLGGDNRPFNLSMLLKPIHRGLTAAVDIPAIAKVKRGLRKRAGQAKRKAQMPYTRAAATHKRKLSGEVVRRVP